MSGISGETCRGLPPGALSPARPPSPPRPETARSGMLRYRLAGIAGAGMIRALGPTLRIEWDLPDSVRRLERDGHHMLHAFWHAHILTFSYTHRGRGAVVLVSRHGDGEYISQVIHRLGFGTVRGSSSRGGVRSLLEMARLGSLGHPLSVTPDGPRGPRRVLQGGALLIAQKSGLPIVPYSTSARPCRKLRSWDQFEIPLPGARVYITAGEPIHLPGNAPVKALENEWAPLVQAAMLDTEHRAERWAEER